MPRKRGKASTRQEPEAVAPTRVKGTMRSVMCVHRIPPESHCKTCDT